MSSKVAAQARQDKNLKHATPTVRKTLKHSVGYAALDDNMEEARCKYKSMQLDENGSGSIDTV